MTKDTLLYLDLEIQEYVKELKELTKTVKEVDDAYNTDPSEENRLFLFETIDRYKAVVNRVRILLEAFFSESRNMGEPEDFLYHRLYKKLGDAY